MIRIVLLLALFLLLSAAAFADIPAPDFSGSYFHSFNSGDTAACLVTSWQLGSWGDLAFAGDLLLPTNLERLDFGFGAGVALKSISKNLKVSLCTRNWFSDPGILISYTIN